MSGRMIETDQEWVRFVCGFLRLEWLDKKTYRKWSRWAEEAGFKKSPGGLIFDIYQDSTIPMRRFGWRFLKFMSKNSIFYISPTIPAKCRSLVLSSNWFSKRLDFVTWLEASNYDSQSLFEGIGSVNINLSAERPVGMPKDIWRSLGLASELLDKSIIITFE